MKPLRGGIIYNYHVIYHTIYNILWKKEFRDLYIYHIYMILADPKVSKVSLEFNCVCCDYKCSKKQNYLKHLATQKHKNLLLMANSDVLPTNTDVLPTNTDIKVSKVSKVAKPIVFTCDCGKEYKHNRSLWSHKKTCEYKEPVCVEIQKTTDVSSDMVAILMGQLDKKDKQMMEQLEKQRDESREQIELLTNTIKEMIPKMGSNNNNNQHFNINMFLNEECKDAINMSEFVESIQVSLAQLQYTTNNGLEKGLTNVIMENMNKLSKYERPLHCTDTKRETLYIKENDKWEKDTGKEKLKKVLNKTSNKNYTALTNWSKENPNFMQRDDQQNFYARSMSAVGKPITGVEDKIIKQICKDIYVKE